MGVLEGLSVLSERKRAYMAEWRRANAAHVKAARAQRYQQNKEEENAQSAAYYRANAEEIKEAARRRFAADGGVQRAASARWKAKNAERVAEYKRAKRAQQPKKVRPPKDPTAALRAKKAWKARNPHRVAGDKIARLARTKHATPARADKELMADIYALARIYREHTPVIAHVDHIVPLRSPLVCGLHTHDNLSCLPRDENIRKGNRVWPGSTGDPV